MKNYDQFTDYNHYVCGMATTEDGAVHCCECDEPIYEDDYPNHDWSTCPVCGSAIEDEEVGERE